MADLTWMILFLPVFIARVSCKPGWPQTWYVYPPLVVKPDCLLDRLRIPLEMNLWVYMGLSRLSSLRWESGPDCGWESFWGSGPGASRKQKLN